MFWQGKTFLFEASSGLSLGPVETDAEKAMGLVEAQVGVACSASVLAREGSSTVCHHHPCHVCL